jgi:hypothetical protein
MIRVLFGEGKVVRRRAGVNTLLAAFFADLEPSSHALIHPVAGHRFTIPRECDRLRR